MPQNTLEKQEKNEAVFLTKLVLATTVLAAVCSTNGGGKCSSVGCSWVGDLKEVPSVAALA